MELELKKIPINEIYKEVIEENNLVEYIPNIYISKYGFNVPVLFNTETHEIICATQRNGIRTQITIKTSEKSIKGDIKKCERFIRDIEQFHYCVFEGDRDNFYK